MKILIIDHDAGTTGSTISMVYLINYWLDKKHQVAVLTIKNDSVISLLDLNERNRSNLRFLKYSSVFLNSWSLDLHFTDKKKYSGLKMIRSVFNLIFKIIHTFYYSFFLLRQTEPDLVYSNEYVSSGFTVVPKILSIKTICHIRSRMIPKGTNKIAEFIVTWLLETYVNNIFCITEIEKQQFSDFPQIIRKCSIVPEFLNGSDFNNDSPSVNSNNPCILMAGGVSEIKGTIDFIKAINILLTQGYELTAIISGKIYEATNAQKTYANRCRKEIELSGHSKRFSIRDNIRKTELFHNIDILAVTNIESHFSRPIIEAWANRVTVVAYKNEHNSNLVDDEVDGFLTENNPEDLANKIKRLIDEPEIQTYLKTNAFIKARNNFETEKVLQNLFE